MATGPRPDLSPWTTSELRFGAALLGMLGLLSFGRCRRERYHRGGGYLPWRMPHRQCRPWLWGKGTRCDERRGNCAETVSTRTSDSSSAEAWPTSRAFAVRPFTFSYSFAVSAELKVLALWPGNLVLVLVLVNVRGLVPLAPL